MSQGKIPAINFTASARSIIVATAVLAVCGVFASVAQAQDPTITWVGGSGSNWTNVGNWSPSRLPTTTDYVLIPAGTSPTTVNILSGTHTIAGLTCGRGLKISGTGVTLSITDTAFTSTINGNLTLESNGALSGAAQLIVSGTLTWNSGGAMRGAGTTIIESSGTLMVSGNVNLTGRTLENRSTSALSSIAGSVFFDNASTFRNQAGAQFTVGSSVLGMSSFNQGPNGPNLFVNAGTLIKDTSQTLRINVPCTVAQTGDIDILAGTVEILGTFTNFTGTTLADGTYNVAGILQFASANIVTNSANITLNGPDAQILNSGTSADALVNLAAVASDHSLTLKNGRVLTTTTSLTNAGTIAIGDASAVGGGACTLAVGGAYTQTAGATLLDGGTLATLSGISIQAGTLSGTGTLVGDVVNAGTVAPGLSPGILGVTGNYTQQEGGTLAVELAGLTAGTEYDRLQVTGTAALAGTLNVGLLNGFVPAASDTFQIMTFASPTGDFTTLLGQCLSTSFTATSLSLKVNGGYAAPGDVLADPAMIPSGGSSTLTATPGDGGTGVQWFADSCGGTPIPGAAPVVSPAVTTTYYVRTTGPTSGCGESPCASVTVTVGSPPARPTHVKATPRSLCLAGGSTVLTATPGAGGDTVDWFTDSCGQTLVPGGAAPSVTPTVTTTYYARSRNSTTGSVSATCAAFTVIVGQATLGDFDGDCDVDADDLATFNACVSGPDNDYPAEDPCLKGDFDGDFDVDQDDYGYFQHAYTGAPAAPVDYDLDGDVDRVDWEVFAGCFSGPAVLRATTPACVKSDLDRDYDVDLNDFGVFQRCFSGTDELADLDCAD